VDLFLVEAEGLVVALGIDVGPRRRESIPEVIGLTFARRCRAERFARKQADASNGGGCGSKEAAAGDLRSVREVFHRMCGTIGLTIELALNLTVTEIRN
jgi:hypothetical protein